MLSPNHLAHDFATKSHDERINHAARINMIRRNRRDGSSPFHRDGFRRLTATRLAAAAGAVVLSVVAAAGAVAAAAGSSVGGGGGGILLY